jgi:hypothetical protein
MSADKPLSGKNSLIIPSESAEEPAHPLKMVFGKTPGKDPIPSINVAVVGGAYPMTLDASFDGIILRLYMLPEAAERIAEMLALGAAKCRELQDNADRNGNGAFSLIRRAKVNGK